MTLRVSKVTVVDGVPIVPGAAFVTRGDAGWWFAEFLPIGFGGNISLCETDVPGWWAWKGTRGRQLASNALLFDEWVLTEAGRGHRLYRVTGVIPLIDALGNPVDVFVDKGVVRLPEEPPMREATDAQPWSIQGATIRQARPALRTVAGAHVDDDNGGDNPIARRRIGVRRG